VNRQGAVNCVVKKAGDGDVHVEEIEMVREMEMVRETEMVREMRGDGYI
jgi:hypothetical protein